VLHSALKVLEQFKPDVKLHFWIEEVTGAVLVSADGLPFHLKNPSFNDI